ncbi:MAG: hypothetical protein GY777_21430 [Candidatus Brocadiaceae bacterium]|nr:hypothetical protein [Candidatus Brocadiaceae bacterium]
MLKGSDCDIINAYDGEGALLRIAEKKPDLIITDILFKHDDRRYAILAHQEYA